MLSKFRKRISTDSSIAQFVGYYTQGNHFFESLKHLYSCVDVYHSTVFSKLLSKSFCTRSVVPNNLKNSEEQLQ